MTGMWPSGVWHEGVLVAMQGYHAVLAKAAAAPQGSQESICCTVCRPAGLPSIQCSDLRAVVLQQWSKHAAHKAVGRRQATEPCLLCQAPSMLPWTLEVQPQNAEADQRLWGGAVPPQAFVRG